MEKKSKINENIQENTGLQNQIRGNSQWRGKERIYEGYMVPTHHVAEAPSPAMPSAHPGTSSFQAFSLPGDEDILGSSRHGITCGYFGDDLSRCHSVVLFIDSMIQDHGAEKGLGNPSSLMVYAESNPNCTKSQILTAGSAIS